MPGTIKHGSNSCHWATSVLVSRGRNGGRQGKKEAFKLQLVYEKSGRLTGQSCAGYSCGGVVKKDPLGQKLWWITFSQLWGSSAHQLSCISDVYIVIRNSNKITAMK